MSRTSSSGTQRQFTLTRRDDLSEYQKAMFDLMQSWGQLRLSLLTCLFKTVFSEEEITDKEACSLKLYALAKGNIDNPKPLTRTTDPAQAPAPAVKPEPVTSVPTIKEETPADKDEQLSEAVTEETPNTGFDWNDLGNQFPGYKG